MYRITCPSRAPAAGRLPHDHWRAPELYRITGHYPTRTEKQLGLAPRSLVAFEHAGEPGHHDRGQQPSSNHESEGQPGGIPVRDEGIPLAEEGHRQQQIQGVARRVELRLGDPLLAAETILVGFSW